MVNCHGLVVGMTRLIKSYRPLKTPVATCANSCFCAEVEGTVSVLILAVRSGLWLSQAMSLGTDRALRCPLMGRNAATHLIECISAP